METAWVSGAATLSNPQNCLEGLPLQFSSVQQTFFEHLMCDESWEIESQIRQALSQELSGQRRRQISK